MSNPQLRQAALRLGSRLSRRTIAPALSQTRNFSVELKKWQELGYVDDKGLTVFDTLHEMQVRSCQTYGKNNIFGTYSADKGEFEWMTFTEYGEAVDKCRAVLKDIGTLRESCVGGGLFCGWMGAKGSFTVLKEATRTTVKVLMTHKCLFLLYSTTYTGVMEFSKVGIISNNRWEWATIAAASYSLNATIVPMYEAQLAADWTYILNDSGCTALFCATQDIFDQVQKEVLPSTPLVKSVLCLDAPEGESHAFATAMAKATADSASLILEPTQDDLADLIYTSGTTGKGCRVCSGVYLTLLKHVLAHIITH